LRNKIGNAFFKTCVIIFEADFFLRLCNEEQNRKRARVETPAAIFPWEKDGKRIVYGHVQYLSGCEMLGFCSDLECADMQWDELLLHRFLIATGEHKEEGYREFQSEGLHDEGVPPG